MDIPEKALEIYRQFQADNEDLLDEVKLYWIEFSKNNQADAEMLRGTAELFGRGRGNTKLWGERRNIYEARAAEAKAIYEEKFSRYLANWESAKSRMLEVGFEWPEDQNPSEDWPMVSDADN